MTVRYIETLHEKLSIPCEEMPRNFEENFKETQWNVRRENAFGEVTNLTSKRNQQQKRMENKNKTWNENQENHFDKENFDVLTLKQENRLTFEENHWRPW
jgi:hypothetical protein